MRGTTMSIVSISSLTLITYTLAAALPNAAPFIRSESLLNSAYSLDLTRRYGHRTHGANFRDGVHSSSIFSRLKGSDYSFSILWGSRNLSVEIDTGSSDLWVASSNFTCLTNGGRVISLESCGFGEYINKGFEDGQINDQFFDEEYGYASIHGNVGYEDITVAGIEVKHQEVVIATKGFWQGDNVTAGLMGLSYPFETMNYAFRNGTLIVRRYLPWFFSAFHRGLIPPVFSLALQRSDNNEPAGRIAFGGLPSLDFSPKFISVPMKTYPKQGYPRPVRYEVEIDGWVVDGTFFPLNSTGRNHLIDSGSPSLYISNKIAATINAKFSPRGNYSNLHFQWQVPCNARPPNIAVRISGHDFRLDPKDLIEPVEQGYHPNQTGYCVSAAQNANSFPVLGDAFLKNVIAVFDVGAGEMRFAQHHY